MNLKHTMLCELVRGDRLEVEPEAGTGLVSFWGVFALPELPQPI